MPPVDLLVLEDHVVETRAGPRTVVSLTPRAPIIFRRTDLAAMVARSEASPRDREIIRRLCSRDRPADVFVFQSQAPDGDGCWSFDEDLTDEEATELGYQIVRTHRYVYRGLVDAGISMAIGAAKGFRELECLRAGTRRFIEELSDELPRLTGQARLECEADLFMVRHLMVFTSLHLPQLLEGVIPDKLPLCQRRAPRFRDLRSQMRTLVETG